MRHPSGRYRLSKRRGTSLYSGGVPQVGRSFRALGTGRHARGWATGIVSQTVGAIALSRSVSDVARYHAGELTEVNRGLRGT